MQVTITHVSDFPSFGDYLRELLDRAEDMDTPADLSRRSGISETNISRWMRGKTLPSLDNAKALAEVLNRPVLEVLVASGLLTSEQAHQRVTTPSLAKIDDDTLLREVRRRMHGPPPPEGVTSDPERFTVIRRSRTVKGEA